MKKTFTVSQNSTQETIDFHEQKTRYPGIRNNIISQETDDKYEQNTGFFGIIWMDSQDFMDPRDHYHAIARSKDIPNILSGILSSKNKTGIMPSSKGVTA